MSVIDKLEAYLAYLDDKIVNTQTLNSLDHLIDARAATLNALGISNGNAANNNVPIGTPSMTQWQSTSASSVALVSNVGYVCNGNSLQSLTLPSNGAMGDSIEIYAVNASTVRIVQQSGQYITFNDGTTTVGVSGRLDVIFPNTSLRLLCINASHWALTFTSNHISLS